APLAVRSGAEDPLEQQARVGLGRDRGRRRLPGEVVLVGAGVAVVAVAGPAARVAAQLQGGEAGEVADVVGHDLVDGHAGVDVGAAGLLDADAGEEGAAGAGVVTAAVVAGGGVAVVEAAEDLDLVL